MSNVLESRRASVVYQLLMVLTLLFLSTFLWTYFTFSNFAVPCTENVASGARGIVGIEGVPGKDNLKTGNTGGKNSSIGPKGKRGDTGESFPGPTGPASRFNTGPGPVGPQGPTGETAAGGFDGPLQTGLLFITSSPTQLSFYEQVEVLANVSADNNLTKDVKTTKVVLTRYGSIVNMNVYPFLLYPMTNTFPTAVGALHIDVFTKTQPLSEFSPTNFMSFPIIVSQGGQDTSGMLQILPSPGGCVLLASYTTFVYPYTPGQAGSTGILTNNPGTPAVDQVFFSDQPLAMYPPQGFAGTNSYPWGLQGMVTVSWTV